MAITRSDIDAILATFEQSEWRTIHLKADGVEVMLSKEGAELPPSAPAIPRIVPENDIPKSATPPAPDAPDDGSVVVAAPSIGTFYRAPKPGAPPFTQAGARVEEGDDLCLIEVMKLFTSVTAPVSGTVAEIVASDGDLVEYGQPLLRIVPDEKSRA